jgi:hypothetical protein
MKLNSYACQVLAAKMDPLNQLCHAVMDLNLSWAHKLGIAEDMDYPVYEDWDAGRSRNVLIFRTYQPLPPEDFDPIKRDVQSVVENWANQHGAKVLAPRPPTKTQNPRSQKVEGVFAAVQYNELLKK